MTSSVDGGLSTGRALQAVNASPEAFRGASEDNFRFTVAHADRDLFKAPSKGYLRRRHMVELSTIVIYVRNGPENMCHTSRSGLTL